MGVRLKATRAERDRSTSASVLAHPLRVRVLEILNERDMSPIEFCRDGYGPADMDVSYVAYHFRELAQFGCLEVVETKKRRGSIEHVYRGLARAFFSDDHWARLTRAERAKISKTMVQGLLARIEGAMMSEAFDSRIDRHLSWVAMKLDEQGYGEMSAALATAFEEIERIRSDAERRLDDLGEDGIPATCGLLGFPSPADSLLSRPVTDNT